jgi:AraC-like DNA-binding protein
MGKQLPQPIWIGEPDARVSGEFHRALADQFRALQRIAIDAGDETFRLSKRPLALGATDFVGETLRDVPCLGEAMRRIARGYNLLHGGQFNHVDHCPRFLTYRISDKGFPFALDPDDDTAVATMESVLIMLHAMLSIAVGRDLRSVLRLVRTRRRRTAHETSALRFWSAPVRYGAPAYSLVYAADAASLPVRTGVPVTATAVYDWIIRAAETHEAAGSADDLVRRVQAAIVSGDHDQEQIARQLGLSVATLRRRLAQQRRSFRMLRAETLLRRARTMLSNGHSVEVVAEALGFADARSFRRAFKEWTGDTPSAFLATVARTGAT